MAGLANLVKWAERRTEAAVLAGQRLSAQCADAHRKLHLLERHKAQYRGLIEATLQQGMPADAVLAYIGFIGQIETVIARQQTEIEDLEKARRRQREELVNSRCEQRMYELLSERAAARCAAMAAHRLQAEGDELLLRAARPSLVISRDHTGIGTRS